MTPSSRIYIAGHRGLVGSAIVRSLQAAGHLQRLYENGQAAVLANVGTLDRPVTLAEAKAGVGLPAKLFSHNDQ